MDEVEVRELKYFHAVAEELNFSRAATRLGMAQPPLSRAIRTLERRLGVQLFERTSHEVSLTPAGQVLLTQSAKALDAISAAVWYTRRAGQEKSALVVTAKPGIASGLLRQIADACPAEIEILVSGFGEQTAMVRDGRADAALLGGRGKYDDLDVEVLYTEPRFAALPSAHVLARRPGLTCADLTGLVTPELPRTSAADRAYWAGQDVAGGPVLLGPMVRDTSQILETVALGQTVALIPESLATSNVRDDVVYRPVLDATPYSLAVAWPAGSRDLRTAQFVRSAVELTASNQWAEMHILREVPNPQVSSR
jgi:DNA-binding transcriptional LysR family regulator